MYEPWALLQHVYFKLNPGLSAQDWEAIKFEHTILEVSKGTRILDSGQVCRFVSLISKGVCRMYHEKEGKEVVFDFYEEGKLISDYASFIKQQPGRCTIEALEDCTLIELGFENVNRLYSKVPAMYKTVTYSLDALFLAHFQKYSSVLLDDLETRYKNFIETRGNLSSRIPQYMIASYLGISPEALTRLRRRMGM